MGLIVLDTGVPIDFLRGDPECRNALGDGIAEGHTLMASVLSRVELLWGMRTQERKATSALFAAVHWVDVDEEISELAGTYARKFRRSHQGVGVVDYVIAATSEHLGAQLWTRNVKHFPMFPDLRLPY